MGIIKHFSSSVADLSTIPNLQTSYPDPNPNNYKILRYHEFNNNLIIEIKYLDCTNYEGKKIIYFENCTIKNILKQKSIDPHFCDNKNFLSPTARFEPTEKGWNMALKLMI